MAEVAPYHVVFEDPISGEELGLILRESSGAIGRVARLASPYAAKVGGGDRTLSDLTDLSAYGQSDWRAGRGQDRFEEEDRFYDSRRAETRIKGQVTLGPLAIATGVGDVPDYRPTSVQAIPIGKLSESYQGRAQSFTTPAGGVSCTHIVLMLRASEGGVGKSARNYTIALCSDSGGAPDAVLKSETLDLCDLDTAWEEVVITWDVAQSLTGSTDYWITVVEASPHLSETWYMEWAADKTAGYASGAAMKEHRPWTVGASDVGGDDKIDQTDGFVADTSLDFWFLVNDGPVLAGDVTVNPVAYDGSLYAAAGDTVYKWSGTVWQSSEVQTDKTVTDLLAWGGYLWCARGANTMRCWNGASWADASGTVQAQLLAQYQGYLYRTDPTNVEDLYYTADGTTWSSAVHVGPGDWGITGVTGFRDEVAIANDVGLWLLAADWGYQVLDWSSQEHETNGLNMLAWARTNELFIPVQRGLYRWTGATMVAVGPDTDAGLPEGRSGSVAALCGTVNWLYAAIDAGDSGYSSVLAYAGRDWHEVYRSSQAGARIRALAYDTLSDPQRLWFGEGAQLHYMELPDFTDNPYQYAGICYTSDAEIELSSWGSELLPVSKDWRYVILQAENCTSARTIEVYYEIDRSGLWVLVGTVSTGHTLHKLEFPARSFVTKTTASGCTTTTIALGTGSTGDMTAGDWVRIGTEVRQVAEVGGDSFTVVLPFTSAPAAGESVYASAPVGSELRLRLRLTTETETESPKLLAVACYCDANVLDRWQITLDVMIEEGMQCLNGDPYPLDSEALGAELEKWMVRQTSFTLHDIRGTERTVKVANCAETAARRNSRAPWKYGSTMHIGLIEMEVR